MKTLLIFLIILFPALNSFAQEYKVVFENNTGEALNELFMTHSRFEWGDNLLEYNLESGESLEIFYESAENECMFDFLAKAAEGATYLSENQDLCQSDYVIFTDAHFAGNYPEEKYMDAHAGDYDEYNPDEDDGDDVEIDGDIKDVVTYNKWKITVNGEEYGTLKLNPDGTCAKTGAGGILPANGTWKLDSTGSILTLHFPEEGPAFEGLLKYKGNTMDVSFYDGAIVWVLVGI